MQKRFFIIALLLIAVLSTTTFFLVLYYFDPYDAIFLSYIVFYISLFVSLSTVGAILLYFIKKVRYRGVVYMYHVKTSLRQGLLLAMFILSGVWSLSLGAPLFLSLVLVGIICFFTEALFRNLDNK